MSTLDDIPFNARSLSYRWDGYDYTFQLDPEQLTVQWQSPVNSGVTKTALREFALSTSSLPGVAFIGGGALLVGLIAGFMAESGWDER